MCFILLILFNIGQTFGACRPADTCSLKSCSVLSVEASVTTCDTILNNYSQMCNCSVNNPKSCVGGKCKTCVLQSEKCNVSPEDPTCCPIDNGKAFCNTGTGICEASRWSCDWNSKCPFDDLSVEEIKNTISIIKNSGKFGPNIQYPIIRQEEPKKALWNAGLAINERLAYAAVLDLGSNQLSEVLVDLNKQSIIKVVILPNKLPPMTPSELNLAVTIALASPKLQEAFLKRNLSINYAQFGLWGIGSSGPLVNLPGKRLIRAVPYYQLPTTEFLDFVPVPNLVFTIDMNKNAIDTFYDLEIIPLTPVATILPTVSDKPPLKPLVITQSQGSSIKVNGQEIEWYKWKMHYNFDPILGLQFHNVRYQADCEERLVIYKISLVEMFVPYGYEGEHVWRWRDVFDCGQYGVGRFTSSLKIGRDVPENSILFTCVIANETGSEPHLIPGCIAAYERDIGILYRHVDYLTRVTESRRGRQLVFTFTASIGNYDYIYDYIFNMDGSIEVKVGFTGIFLAGGFKQACNDPSCLGTCTNIVNEYLIGPPHQHFLTYRIDFDVDGIQNYVKEVDLTNDPISPENPDGGAFSSKTKILEVEKHCDYDFKKSRTWHVVNSESRNKFGSLRGYALKPIDAIYPHLHEGNKYLPQAEYVKHPFWATVFKDDEQTPAGKFPRSGIPYQGLPMYIKDRQSLKNTDVVTWYTFGITHSPRPEEWPIMNVNTAGFLLVPFNFFSQNSEIPLKGKCP